MSPALAGGFLTAEPPGKPASGGIFCLNNYIYKTFLVSIARDKQNLFPGSLYKQQIGVW